MITIISASSRSNNLTENFGQVCQTICEQKNVNFQQFSLGELPDTILLNSVYDYGNSIFTELGNRLILPAEKLLFVVPEYNGSIPGVLKLFIDGMEPSIFKNKKAALIGVAAGRAGNLRGMDHLTDILHHLQVNVMPQKLPISQMYSLMNEGRVEDKETISEITLQVDRLINF